MKENWIFVRQDAETLKKHSGPVVWVSRCERCGAEEPVYEGPLDVAIYQGKKFMERHKRCEERRPNESL